MSSGGASWLEEAKKQVEYTKEALSFLNRARQQFETSPTHARAVAKLWLAADQVDELICTLLEEMNQGLLEGMGELDTTRGAAIRPVGMEEETLFYDCTWSLAWSEDKGIAVNLAVEPRSQILQVQVWARQAMDREAISFPIHDDALKEALVMIYVAEATLEEFNKRQEGDIMPPKGEEEV